MNMQISIKTTISKYVFKSTLESSRYIPTCTYLFHSTASDYGLLNPHDLNQKYKF